MIKTFAFLRKVLIVIFALFITVSPVIADEAPENNQPIISAEYARESATGEMKQELINFGPQNVNITQAFVPIEAKIGVAFMGGLAKVGMALDSSLVRFAIMFMLIAYAFWVAFEAYNLINSGADAKATVKDIIIKGLTISAWILILDFGIARAFTMIMVPIVSLGTFISTTIWNGITSVAGFSVPDNCGLIKEYAAANISPALLHVQGSGVTETTLQGLNITAESAASLICVPSQMSAFFVTVIKIGWDWIVSSVGVGLFGAVLGLYVVYLGLKNIWKFLFVALGVIADLFLGLLMLPFTAIAETTAKTNYKGVAGGIFNSFLEIFKTESLKKQINRLVNASVYFICLSVVIGVAVSLLAVIVNPSGQISSDMNMDGLGGVLILILVLLLVCHMADKATELAKKWGGEIDTSAGDKAKKDIEKLWELTKDTWKKMRGISGANANKFGNGNGGSGGGTDGDGADGSNNNNPIADIALIGMPQTGKYTLLRALTPNIMTVNDNRFSSKPVRYGFLRIGGRRCIAMYLPGLAGGASTSVTNGNRFLRYAEKAKVILHIIDAGSSDWAADYSTVRNEMRLYGGGLISKPEIVVITKTDTISDADLTSRMDAFRLSFGTSTVPVIVPVSANNHDGLDQLVDEIKNKM